MKNGWRQVTMEEWAALPPEARPPREAQPAMWTSRTCSDDIRDRLKKKWEKFNRDASPKEQEKMLAASSVKNRRPVEMNGVDLAGSNVPMYQVPWEVFADLNWSTTGTPVLFAMHEDQLWLWPTPVGDGSYFTVTVGQGSGE